MTSYVDHARIPFGRMLMNHLMADTSYELLAMCRSLGLRESYIQHPGTAKEHLDVSESQEKRSN